MDQALPSTDRCILHLRLLASFDKLRDSVQAHDGLFGCCDSGGASKGDLRWFVYVAKAAKRFEKWYDTLVDEKDLGLKSWREQYSDWKALAALTSAEPRLAWSDRVVPPLDVLMVLHSYMLNPRDFLEDSLRHGSLSVWKAGFPWTYVEEYLDPESLIYEPPQTHVDPFEQVCDEKWDGLDNGRATLQCPGCSKPNSVRWTDLYCDENNQSEKGNTHMSFQVQCSDCGQRITQETLALARLRDDLQQLQDHGIPLPGTLLTIDGRVTSIDGQKFPESLRHPALLNELMLSNFGNGLLERLIEDMSSQHPSMMIETFREEAEQRITGSDDASRTSISTALRRMMARRYRNASPFALDLVGAVLRQGTFVTKMQSFDWIHSPALMHTVIQAIKRYTGFFRVMATYPKNVAVPTFDVDLVWHTHQLSPPSYYEYSTRVCNNVLIDHDDKIGDGVLGYSFEWTCKAYHELTGEQYDKCLCWSCELLERAALNPPASERKAASSLASRIKNKIKRAEAKYEFSPAEIEVIRIQLRMFENDYASIRSQSLAIGKEAPTKLDYFSTYSWHHPSFAPLAQELRP